MARIVRRVRIKEGTGIGERIAEISVFIILIGALFYGGRWYFAVYRHSPGVALQKFLSAINRGDAADQYALLSAGTKQRFYPTEEAYKQTPLAQGFITRITYDIGKLTVTESRAQVDVAITVRRSGQQLYQADKDSFTDRYILRNEQGEWKIALEESQISSAQAASKGGQSP